MLFVSSASFFLPQTNQFRQNGGEKKNLNLNPEIINDQDHVTHTKSNYNTIF